MSQALLDPAADAKVATDVTAVLSLLHEPADRNSASRIFRGRPVLWWTLQRLSHSSRVDSAAVLCWDDQFAAVAPLAAAAGAEVHCKGPRVYVSQLEVIAASRRWADGWRGGLLGTCDFDQGFHAAFFREAAEAMGSGAVLLIDPAAGLVDPALIDALVDHAEAREEVEICIAPAAPGLCGALVRRPLLDRLVTVDTHPGRLMHYHPDKVSREPLAGDGCAPVPTIVARSTGRFTLSSDRQVERLSAAFADLESDLMDTGAEALVRRLQSRDVAGPLPREIVLELNTERLSRPIYWPGRHLHIERPELSLERARALFAEMREQDETRLTLAGLGDPLLAANVFEIIDAAVEAGLAVHVETDLLNEDADAIRRLAASGADVVSFHAPGLSPQTYEAVMGIDGYARLLDNVRAFVAERAARQRGVPLLVPLFTKCQANLHEMEPWYDQWLRALGAAVIVGPSTYAGLIPDASVADMAPPRRRACARLASRATVLSDGNIVSCEQDVRGNQVMGILGIDTLADVWRAKFGAARAAHASISLEQFPLCRACKEWHRP